MRIRVEEPFAPLREGTHAVIRLTSLSGIANRFIALTPAPNSAKQLDDGATLAAGSTTGVVDLDQLFNTLDPKARKDLQGVIQGFATQYDGRGKEAGETAEYFNPFLSTSRQLVNQLTQDEGTLTDFIVNSSRAVTAIAEKRDDLASLVGNTNTTAAAIASQDAALEQALGAAADHAAARQHDVRQPARDARRPRPAGRRVQAGDQGARAVPARAAPAGHRARSRRSTTCAAWSRRPGANNDLIDATRKMPALQRVASPTFKNSTQALVKSQPVLEYIRPYTPELTGWFHDFGQGTANYDANGHFARIQPIFNAFQFTNTPAGGELVPNAMNGRFDGLAEVPERPLPGRGQPADGGRLGAYTDDGNLGADDCDPSQVLAGPLMKRVASVLLLLALGAAAVLTAGAGDGGTYKVRAIFDNAGFVIPGEDVKVAGVKVGKVDSLDVTPDFKAVVVLDIDDPAYQDFRSDASCQVRPQSLIGEKFVECSPTQKRAVGTEPPPALKKIDRGAGRGPVPAAGREHRAVGRPRPDQQHHAPALPGAVLADPQRARHRPRRPRQGDQRGRPPRRPRAQADRPRAQDPRPRRTRSWPTSRATPTPRSRRSRASASTSAPSSSTRAGWPRRPPSGATTSRPTSSGCRASSHELTPTMQRIGGLSEQATPVFADLGAQRAGHQPHDREPRAVLGGRPPGRQVARRRVGDRHARDEGPAADHQGPAALRQDREAGRQDGGRHPRVVPARPAASSASLDYAFYQVAAINGYDSIGHYLRARLIVNTCSSYYTAPVEGCSARFASSPRRRSARAPRRPPAPTRSCAAPPPRCRARTPTASRRCRR